MPSSTYLRQAMLDQVFRATGTPIVPTTIWVALYTSPTDNVSGGDEVIGNDYARVSTAFSAPDTNGRMVNSSEITFPTATPSSWGLVTHIRLWDAASGGNPLWHGPLESPIRVYAETQMGLPAGNLVLELA